MCLADHDESATTRRRRERRKRFGLVAKRGGSRGRECAKEIGCSRRSDPIKRRRGSCRQKLRRGSLLARSRVAMSRHDSWKKERIRRRRWGEARCKRIWRGEEDERVYEGGGAASLGGVHSKGSGMGASSSVPETGGAEMSEDSSGSSGCRSMRTTTPAGLSVEHTGT